MSNLGAKTLLRASLSSNSSRTAPKLFQRVSHIAQSNEKGQEKGDDIPITPRLHLQLPHQRLPILTSQLDIPRMTTNDIESHHGRQLAIEGQALAEGKEIDEVHVGNIERFVRIGFIGVIADVGEGRTGSHEGVARGRGLDFGLAAHAHVLFVVHAGLFETARNPLSAGERMEQSGVVEEEWGGGGEIELWSLGFVFQGVW